ncbi:hypothetical protein [Hymenobacter swuensis]|uniref:hypothetical protein n=1 Tax=Hymenobacter swuensis TaxID=1446467 RepID=UPI0012DE8CF5|nr:hypothetical protein [Hymenobacter swuensis]
MPVHHRDEKYLDEVIRQRFSSAFMSNSKWVKLLSTLIANSLHIKQCRIRLIWDDTKPYRRLVFDENTQFGLDYYETSMEAMVSGKPRGWYDYKEIEWLDFPSLEISEGSAPAIQQDIETIQSLIDGTGQYRTEITADNLRLYAYL